MFTIVPQPAQGWECPKCHRIYAPATVMCLSCPAQTITTAGTNDITSGTITVTPCDHDWNEDLTVPACRKCGTMKPLLSPFSYTIYPLGGPNT